MRLRFLALGLVFLASQAQAGVTNCDTLATAGPTTLKPGRVTCYEFTTVTNSGIFNGTQCGSIDVSSFADAPGGCVGCSFEAFLFRCARSDSAASCLTKIAWDVDADGIRDVNLPLTGDEAAMRQGGTMKASFFQVKPQLKAGANPSSVQFSCLP